MSQHNFQVREHVVPCSHVREFPRALQNEDDDVLHLHVKSYTPLSNSRAEPFDVTFIAAHANGVNKEMYEPLWDELLAYSRRTKKFRIRSIWIADAAHQGQSSVLNEGKLGNDPSWQDHPRDLFLMINHFRKAMPQPLVGIGHSFGGNNILNLALMHPRLFTSIIMLDPVAQGLPSVLGTFKPAYASTFRRDLWPSREAAREAFLKNSYYTSWDPRVFDIFIKYGLRELPTELYPAGTVVPEKSAKSTSARLADAASNLAVNPSTVAVVPSSAATPKPVTLTTTKHQEVFTFARGKHPAAGQPMSSFRPTRTSHPDLPSTAAAHESFYSSGSFTVFNQLPHLRPSCIYILGESSSLVSRDILDERLAKTGAGDGGSGGVAEDMVRETIVSGGHFFPFEKPLYAAREMGLWLDERIPVYRQETTRQRAEWARLKPTEKNTLSADHVWWVKRDLADMEKNAKSSTAEQREEATSTAGSKRKASKI